jgi:hypothetical protein
MKKVKIGHITVDSGQVLIVDPAYLDQWKQKDFEYESGIKRGKVSYKLWGKALSGGKMQQINWATPLDAEGGKSMNDLLQEEGWEEFNNYPDSGEFSYSGVSSLTVQDRYGEIIASGFATAVASTTGWGDGQYPVYATIKDGRVAKIEIDFM